MLLNHRIKKTVVVPKIKWIFYFIKIQTKPWISKFWKKLELFNNKVLVVWYTFPGGRCWGSTVLHHHEIQNMRLESRIWNWGSGKHNHLPRNQEGRSLLSSSPRSLCSWGSKRWKILLSSLEFCLKTHKALEICSCCFSGSDAPLKQKN